MSVDLTRASAFAALLIVLAGFLLIVRPLEAAVAERYAGLDAARASLERSVVLSRRIPALERERAGLREQLRRLHLGDRRAAMLERFLHAMGGIARTDGVAVVRIAATLPSPFAAAPRPAPTPLLEEVPLELTVRGRYGDVIRAARDLGSGELAAHVTIGSLGGSERRPGRSPSLNATLHVILLRAAG
ncbi:MAG TPA: hypothetical protein VGP41_14280 [Candidatus Lustribacter sp.]|nr:hypothetical protein [Candidatus Lustribacter sp.]